MRRVHRVHVTIPEEVEGLFEWYLRQGPFQGNAAALVSHFFRNGIQAAYEKGLAEAPGYNADEFTQLAEHQRAALAERAAQTEE